MPNKQKVTRKLRAILSADVKGYSLLMADDEAITIETLKEYRGSSQDCGSTCASADQALAQGAGRESR